MQRLCPIVHAFERGLDHVTAMGGRSETLFESGAHLADLTAQGIEFIVLPQDQGVYS
jgi:hypothetical protein